MNASGWVAPTDESRQSSRLVQKYSPDQPRVPAGNPDGGQWTIADHGGGLSEISAVIDVTPTNDSAKRQRYAALETGTQTDATDTKRPFIQYAAGDEDDDGSENRYGEPLEGTEEQQARLQGAGVTWRTAQSRVLKIDPSWKPSPVLVDPTSIESNIARLKAWTEEAEAYLVRLRDLAVPRNPNTGDPVESPVAETGNPLIDYTTKRLMDILGDVIDKVGPRPDLSRQRYGTLIHTEFAKAVRAAGLRGIGTEGVESTFGTESDAPAREIVDDLEHPSPATLAAIKEIKERLGRKV